MNETVRLRLIKAALTVFALITAPALVWRWQQVAHVPEPLTWVARGLFVVGVVWDVYLLYEALTLKATASYWRWTRKLLPRLLLTFALAMLVDAPAYARRALPLEITHWAQTDTQYDRPESYRLKQYRDEVERWRFVTDPPTLWAWSSLVNTQREEFYDTYTAIDALRLHRFGSPTGCARFKRESARVDLSHYPGIVAKTDRLAGLCDARRGDYHLAAAEYHSYAHDAYPDNLMDLNALFDAWDDHAPMGLIHVLQSDITNTPADRVPVRNVCLGHYHESLRSMTWGRKWTAQDIKAQRAWRERWAAMVGNVCAALHAQTPYTVQIPLRP